MLWKYRSKINCSQNFSLPVHMTKLFTSGLFKPRQKSAISGPYWAEKIPCELRKVTDPVTSPRWSLWQSVCNTCSTLPLFQCGWLVTVVLLPFFAGIAWNLLSPDTTFHITTMSTGWKKKKKKREHQILSSSKKKSLRPLFWKPSSNLKLKNCFKHQPHRSYRFPARHLSIISVQTTAKAGKLIADLAECQPDFDCPL